MTHRPGTSSQSWRLPRPFFTRTGWSNCAYKQSPAHLSMQPSSTALNINSKSNASDSLVYINEATSPEIVVAGAALTSDLSDSPIVTNRQLTMTRLSTSLMNVDIRLENGSNDIHLNGTVIDGVNVHINVQQETKPKHALTQSQHILPHTPGLLTYHNDNNNVNVQPLGDVQPVCQYDQLPLSAVNAYHLAESLHENIRASHHVRRTIEIDRSTRNTSFGLSLCGIHDYIYVSHVYLNSPAWNLGISEGDIILSANDMDVQHWPDIDLYTYINDSPKVKLEICDGGLRTSHQITVGLNTNNHSTNAKQLKENSKILRHRNQCKMSSIASEPSTFRGDSCSYAEMITNSHTQTLITPTIYISMMRTSTHNSSLIPESYENLTVSSIVKPQGARSFVSEHLGMYIKNGEIKYIHPGGPAEKLDFPLGARIVMVNSQYVMGTSDDDIYKVLITALTTSNNMQGEKKPHRDVETKKVIIECIRQELLLTS